MNHNKNVTTILDKSDSEEEQEYIPNSENQQDMCEDWVPSTILLWGDSDSPVSHKIVANLEQESVTLDDIRLPCPGILYLHGVSILVEILK